MKKKILLKGPLLTRSGYGEQTRFALRALRTREDIFDIYIQPLRWGTTSWIVDDNEERSWIDQNIEKTIGFIRQGGQFDVSMQVTIPSEWEQLAPINIGYTAGIETTRVAHKWIEKGNIMDKIITISSHSKQSFQNSIYEAINQQTNERHELRLSTPIDIVGYPVKVFENLPNLDINLDYDYNFLTIAQFGLRKNLPNTIKWFVEEFHDDEVGLLVKSNMSKNCLMDRRQLEVNLKGILNEYKNRKCKVYFIHGDMTDEEIHSLYVHPKIKALLALPHGEGFGLPIFEAAYSGLPVVATGWSGQLDYLVDASGQEQFYSVAFDIQPVQEKAVWEDVVTKESMWAFPREQSAKLQMRLCYEQNEKDDFCEYAEKLKETFKEKNLYDEFITAMGFRSTKLDADLVFVSDLFSNQHLGGAELSLQTLLNCCPEGKSSERINSSNITTDLIDNNKSSTWIFGNIAQLSDDLIQYIANSGIKYYFIEYDYKYCEYRNPVLYQFLEEESCDYNDTEKGKLIESFVNNSMMTFFMSEKQMQTYLKDLNNLDSNKTCVLSSTFEDEFFDKIHQLNQANQNVERTKWIVLGSRSWVKGAKESEKWCKDNNLDYEVVNNISHEEMLNKLSTARGIFFKPTGLDTCPRFVIEAKLLGCELELNENVQHLSELWFNTDNMEETISYLKERKQFFWSHVE